MILMEENGEIFTRLGAHDRRSRSRCSRHADRVLVR